LDISLYKTIRIPKKRGIRVIHAPCPELKEKQRQYLRNEVMGHLRWPRGITAFLPGRSIVDAARPHIGKKYLVAIDIKDFFHHVTPYHILRAMEFEKFLPREIETRAAPLPVNWKNAAPPNSLLQISFIPSPKVPGEFCLPQGSPLSPYLSLMASKAFYFKILSMLRNKKVKADLTVYADGIFLSSDEKRIIPIGLHGVERILASERFRPNRQKFRVMRSTGAQRVCGITVNRKLSVPKGKRREIRGRVHNLFMDAVNGKEIDVNEFRFLQGFLSFARQIDQNWTFGFEKSMAYIRLTLQARHKIK
jgi:hypothetical protein